MSKIFKIFSFLTFITPILSSSDYTIKLSHKLASEPDFKLRYDFRKSVIPAGKYGITKNQIKKNFDQEESDVYQIKIELPGGKFHQTWVSYWEGVLAIEKNF